MKTITLKFGKEKVGDREVFFSTLALLKSAVNNVTSQQGLSVDEMSKRLRLLDILERYVDFDVADGEFKDWHLEMKKEIELEDSDFQKLKELFKDVKWMLLSRFIVDLSKEFEK
jgi:hypothetical protein